jgi:protein-S-isoprenylcysteine O-methyltransferase Ste14
LDTRRRLYPGLLAGWLAAVTGVPVVRAIARGEPAQPPLHGDVGSPAWWARVASALGVLCAVGAPLLPAGSPRRTPSAAPAVTGTVLVVGGTALTVTGQLAMGDSWRAGVVPGERTELVTSGPFRLVRNPIFTGTFVTTAGLILLLPNPLTVAMLGLCSTAWQIQVRLVEEPHLVATHGARYRDYAARTGRFFPFLGRGVRAG